MWMSLWSHKVIAVLFTGGTRRASGGHPLSEWTCILPCFWAVVQQVHESSRWCTHVWCSWKQEGPSLHPVTLPLCRCLCSCTHSALSAENYHKCTHTGTRTHAPPVLGITGISCLPVDPVLVCLLPDHMASEWVFLCEAHCPIINRWAGLFGPQSKVPWTCRSGEITTTPYFQMSFGLLKLETVGYSVFRTVGIEFCHFC